MTPDETTKFVQRNHHVSLAIDCSGSMDGKKIQDAKDAAINVVRRLSPNDLVSIVTFETEVQVILNPTPASDQNIENVIHSIDVVVPQHYMEELLQPFNYFDKQLFQI